jgi:hypothetical protein
MLLGFQNFILLFELKVDTSEKRGSVFAFFSGDGDIPYL